MGTFCGNTAGFWQMETELEIYRGNNADRNRNVHGFLSSQSKLVSK